MTTVNSNPDTNLWDYVCPHPSGCGDDSGPFRSLGWRTRKLASERGAQHEREHETGEPMQALHEFEAEN